MNENKIQFQGQTTDVNVNQGTNASQNVNQPEGTSWKKVAIAVASALAAIAALATAIVKSDALKGWLERLVK